MNYPIPGMSVVPEFIDNGANSLMFPAWYSCMLWAIGKPRLIALFKQDTGLDVADERDETKLKFLDWATINIWGVQP